MSKDETVHSYRWGIDVSSEDGFTNVFNFILKNYSDMGISSEEMMLIIHIASFHYDSEQGRARPSVETLAKRMGKHPRTISRLAGKLADKGFLIVIPRTGKTNLYKVGNVAVIAKWFELYREQNSDTPPNLDESPGYIAYVKSVKGKRQKSLPKKNPTLDTDVNPTLDTDVNPTLDTDVNLRRKDQEENDKEVMSATHSKSNDFEALDYSETNHSMDDLVEDREEDRQYQTSTLVHDTHLCELPGRCWNAKKKV